MGLFERLLDLAVRRLAHQWPGEPDQRAGAPQGLAVLVHGDIGMVARAVDLIGAVGQDVAESSDEAFPQRETWRQPELSRTLLGSLGQSGNDIHMLSTCGC